MKKAGSARSLLIVSDRQYAFTKYATTSDKIKNPVPNITVARCKNKSSPRAFCLPKRCSAPPEIAPDRPALLPRCSKITAIKPSENMTSTIFKKISTSSTPNAEKQKNASTSDGFKQPPRFVDKTVFLFYHTRGRLTTIRNHTCCCAVIMSPYNCSGIMSLSDRRHSY